MFTDLIASPRVLVFRPEFLDAFSHLYKRVCLSVGPSVTHELNFWEMGEIEQKSTRNKKVCHLKDDSKTSTRAVRQRTLFDLFSL